MIHEVAGHVADGGIGCALTICWPCSRPPCSASSSARIFPSADL